MPPAQRLAWFARAAAAAAVVTLATSARAAAQAAAPADSAEAAEAAEAAEVAAVRRTWLAYLASKEGQYSTHATRPSALWLEAERNRWPLYDLASYYLADGATPEVTSVERVASPKVAGRVEYRITTRFRWRGPTAPPSPWWSAMTMTVYAVKDGDAWRLSNALPRNTRSWRRDTVGPITYVYAPDYPYDRARAERAVAFVDSITAAFSLPPLAPVTYYLTSSVDEVYAIMGLESDVKFGPTGGVAQPVNHQLFSGIPALGEDYRHELTHLAFAPICCSSYLLSEGIATWLGGTSGVDFRGATRALAAFLTERPAVTLDSILAGGFGASQVYPAGAVLFDMVAERGGAAAARDLFVYGGTGGTLRSTLERLLGRPWPAIVADWRRRVVALAHVEGSP